MHLNFLTSGVLWVTSITWWCVHCSFRLVSWTGPLYSLCRILRNYCTFPRISCHAIKQAVSPNHKLQICVPSRFHRWMGSHFMWWKYRFLHGNCWHSTFTHEFVFTKQTSEALQAIEFCENKRVRQRYSTGQATGIAASHACFMSGNPPYCTQIPQEKHAWNTRVKKYMQKYTTKYM